MGKLLIPIDFSENALIAAHYAAEIAVENNDELVFLHVYTAHTNKYANVKVREELIVDPTIAASTERLKKIVEETQTQYPTLQIRSLFDEGVLSEVLAKITEKDAYKAIVMGTKGASVITSALIGSNTYDAIKDSKTPILAIPMKAKTVEKNAIALLTNFKPGELEVLKQAIPIFGTHFHLFLVHINKSEDKISVLDKKLEAWIQKIISETGINDISYTIKNRSYFGSSPENIASGIQTIIRDENIDVILITKSRKSFFQNIFSENIVREMAMEIEIPNFFGKTTISS